MDKKFPNSSPYSQPSWLSWQWRMQISPVPDVPIVNANVVSTSSTKMASGLDGGEAGSAPPSN